LRLLELTLELELELELGAAAPLKIAATGFATSSATTSTSLELTEASATTSTSLEGADDDSPHEKKDVILIRFLYRFAVVDTFEFVNATPATREEDGGCATPPLLTK
jgi:hypothetical protein